MAYKLTMARNSRKAGLKKAEEFNFQYKPFKLLSDGPFFETARERNEYEEAVKVKENEAWLAGRKKQKAFKPLYNPENY